MTIEQQYARTKDRLLRSAPWVGWENDGTIVVSTRRLRALRILWAPGGCQ